MAIDLTTAYSPLLVLDAAAGPLQVGGAACTTAGQAVDAWNDRTAAANHLLYQFGTRATYQPATLNGQPIVRFGGSAAAAIYRTTAQLTYGPSTAFVVAKSTAANAVIYERGPNASTTAGEALSTGNAGNNCLLARRSNLSANNGAGSWVNDSAFHLLVYAWGGTKSTMQLWVDGTLQALAGWSNYDAGATSMADYVYVGNRAAGGMAYSGDVALLALYPALLTPAQFWNVHAHLAARFAIAGGLAPIIRK